MFHTKDFILQVMGEAEAGGMVHVTLTLLSPRTWAMGAREALRVTPGFWPVSWEAFSEKGMQMPEQVSGRREGFAFEDGSEVPRRT